MNQNCFLEENAAFFKVSYEIFIDDLVFCQIINCKIKLNNGNANKRKRAIFGVDEIFLAESQSVQKLSGKLLSQDVIVQRFENYNHFKNKL